MWSNKPLRGNSLPERAICLTFDDGPAHSATLEVAQYLAEERIAATFFLVGRNMEEFPGAAAQLRGLGHVVGNHSFHHRHLNRTDLSDSDVIREVLDTTALLQHGQEGKASPIPFRPPYGAWNGHLTYLMNSHSVTRTMHFGPVLWDFCADDFRFWREGKSPESCADAYMRAILAGRRKSGIVLCHDRTADAPGNTVRNRTPEMIRLLTPRLRDAGFTFSGLFDVPLIQTHLAAGSSKAA